MDTKKVNNAEVRELTGCQDFSSRGSGEISQVATLMLRPLINEKELSTGDPGHFLGRWNSSCKSVKVEAR